MFIAHSRTSHSIRNIIPSVMTFFENKNATKILQWKIISVFCGIQHSQYKAWIFRIKWHQTGNDKTTITKENHNSFPKGNRNKVKKLKELRELRGGGRIDCGGERPVYPGWNLKYRASRTSTLAPETRWKSRGVASRLATSTGRRAHRRETWK